MGKLTISIAIKTIAICYIHETSLGTSIDVYIYIYICTHIYRYVYIYMCNWIYIYIYLYNPTFSTTAINIFQVTLGHQCLGHVFPLGVRQQPRHAQLLQQLLEADVALRAAQRRGDADDVGAEEALLGRGEPGGGRVQIDSIDSIEPVGSIDSIEPIDSIDSQNSKNSIDSIDFIDLDVQIYRSRHRYR